MNLKEFIEKNGIEYSIETAPINPHMEKPETMYHFYIRMWKKNGSKPSKPVNVFGFHYSIGCGHYDKQHAKKAYGFRNMTPYQLQMVKPETIVNSLKPKKPELSEALECIQSDFSGLDVSCFEEWAENYGMETDSRKAEKTYQTIVEQSRDFKKAFGLKLFNELLECQEDD